MGTCRNLVLAGERHRGVGPRAASSMGKAMEQLKVSTKSNPNSVAGAMAGVLRQEGAVEVQVVGAGALNQAIKAVAIARGYVAAGGIDLVCVPTFADIEIDGERRTAIRLVIEDRLRRPIDEHAIPDGALEEFVATERARETDNQEIRLR